MGGLGDPAAGQTKGLGVPWWQKLLAPTPGGLQVDPEQQRQMAMQNMLGMGIGMMGAGSKKPGPRTGFGQGVAQAYQGQMGNHQQLMQQAYQNQLRNKQIESAAEQNKQMMDLRKELARQAEANDDRRAKVYLSEADRRANTAEANAARRHEAQMGGMPAKAVRAEIDPLGRVLYYDKDDNLVEAKSLREGFGGLGFPGLGATGGGGTIDDLIGAADPFGQEATQPPPAASAPPPPAVAAPPRQMFGDELATAERDARGKQRLGQLGDWYEKWATENRRRNQGY